MFDVLCVELTQEGVEVLSNQTAEQIASGESLAFTTPDIFTLNSVTEAYTHECVGCLCNTYPEGWAQTSNLFGMEAALPNPVRTPIDEYETLQDYIEALNEKAAAEAAKEESTKETTDDTTTNDTEET